MSNFPAGLFAGRVAVVAQRDMIVENRDRLLAELADAENLSSMLFMVKSPFQAESKQPRRATHQESQIIRTALESHADSLRDRLQTTEDGLSQFNKYLSENPE